jgi:predicted transcriptional regulator
LAQRPSKNPRLGIQLRTALTNFMDAQKLTPTGWSKLAGVPESTLRNFLAGRSHTLTHGTLMALAGAVQVPLAKLISEGENWSITETVTVSAAVNATERAGEVMSLANDKQFSVRTPSDSRLKDVPKFGARIEDESANTLWPVGSILICADLDWLTYNERPMLKNAPGDLFVVLEKTTRFNDSQSSRIRYVRSTVRKLLGDGDTEYLVSCSNNPRFINAIRLPRPIVGQTITHPLEIGDTSEIILSGKVLASFRSEG